MTDSTGVWTPTLTNTTNLDGSTAYECRYIRIGNNVMCSGRVDLDPTSNGANTLLGMSLPIASTLAATDDLSGNFLTNSLAGNGGGVFADTSNNRASFQFLSGNTASVAYFFNFMYVVI